MKPESTKLIYAEVAYEVAFRCIYTLLAVTNKHKTLNTDVKKKKKKKKR